MKQFLFSIFFLLVFSIAHAQPIATYKCDNKELEAKTKELIEAKKREGFVIASGGFYNMNNNEMLPIMVPLKDKHAYYFIVVGQPDLNFLEVGLGHEAFGTDEVRDRIRKHRDKTFFTHFYYVPPFSGNYLLSITERVNGKKNFYTAVYMMTKVGKEFK